MFWSDHCSNYKSFLLSVSHQNDFFLSIICSDCKNTVFCMLGHQIQNSFDGWKLTELSEVLYEVMIFTDDNNVQWHTLQEDYVLFN